MDTQRFDDLTRSLAPGASRRTLLRGMLGGAAALVGLRAASTAAAPPDKMDICHYDPDSGTYRLFTVNENALDAHIAHGDNSSIGCAEGFQLNLDSCECESVVVDECLGIGASGCGSGGTCAENQDNGQLICVNTGTGNADDNGCTDSSTCSADGEICVLDGTDGDVTHCHFHL